MTTESAHSQRDAQGSDARLARAREILRLLPGGHGKSPLRMEGEHARTFAVEDALILKLCRSHRAWAQEVEALGHVETVSDGLTPSPVAADEGSHALLMTRLPGVPATALAPDCADWTTILRRLGGLTARLHALPVAMEDPTPIQEALSLRAAAWCRRARRAGVPQADALGEMLRDVPAAFAGDGRVWCHRDNQARNWLVREDTLSGLIDFEHARPDHWLADVVKLPDEGHGLGESAALRAFLDGHGQPGLLDDAGFHARWRWMRTLHGLATLTHGVEEGDDLMVTRGRQILADAR